MTLKCQDSRNVKNFHEGEKIECTLTCPNTVVKMKSCDHLCLWFLLALYKDTYKELNTFLHLSDLFFSLLF